MNFMAKKNNFLFFFLGLISVIIVWIIVSLVKNNIFFPSVIDVLIDTFKLLTTWTNIKIILLTILKLILTVFSAYLISLVLGIIAYKSSKIRALLSPIIAIIRCTPVASLIIILILLIGTRLSPIIITLFVLIPLAYEAIYSALNNCDKDIIEETRLISNINLNIIFKVMLPMSFNLLISNVLSCVGLGIKVLVMGEVLSQGANTLGGQIQLARTTIDATRVFSWTLILLILVLLIEYLIGISKKRVEQNF